MRYWYDLLEPFTATGSYCYDFMDAVNVEAVCLVTHASEIQSALSVSYGVDWSDDGTSWTNVASTVTWLQDQVGWERANVTTAGISHRFWRVTVPVSTDDRSLIDVFFFGSGPVINIPCPLSANFTETGLIPHQNRTAVANTPVTTITYSAQIDDGDYTLETMFIRAAESGILLDAQLVGQFPVWPLFCKDSFSRRHLGHTDDIAGKLTLLVDDGSGQNVFLLEQSGEVILDQAGEPIQLFGGNKASQLLTQSGDTLITQSGDILAIY